MTALRRLTRSAVVVGILLYALATSSFVLFPTDASACEFETEWWQTFYAEPEKINVVGECWRPCFGWASCWGCRTDHYNLVSYSCGGGACSP